MSLYGEPAMPCRSRGHTCEQRRPASPSISASIFFCSSVSSRPVSLHICKLPQAQRRWWESLARRSTLWAVCGSGSALSFHLLLQARRLQVLLDEVRGLVARHGERACARGSAQRTRWQRRRQQQAAY